MDLTPIPIGNDVQVNTYDGNEQIHAAVAALTGGGFVVTWASRDQDGSDWGIYSQRYAADGTRLGTEFRVNTFIASEQKYPSVAALAGGGFVVTWTSTGQDGPYEGIFGQQYAADGTRLGSEFRVNSYTMGTQRDSSVAALAGGGFVVTWSSSGQEGDFSIYGQRYTADGAALGTEFHVNTQTRYDQTLTSVAGLAGGGFVVTWSSHLQDGDLSGIYGQRYAANGTALGAEFRVNTTTAGYQDRSSVAALADGGFVVTWDGGWWGMYGQRYTADGTAVGTEFHVYGGLYSSIAALADGGFVVTSSGYGHDGDDGWGIHGQRYTADGTALGTGFRVNQITAGDQWAFSDLPQNFYIGTASTTVAALADGRLVQVWAGDGAEEVFFRLINIPAPPTITSNGAGAAASVSVAENSPVLTTVTASDPNVGQTLSYSIIGGADASKFTIGSATGVLSFNTAPNFELPTDMGGNNIYDVIVEVSDGNGGIDTQAIAVTVTDAFENIAPIITSNGGGNTAAVSVAENSTAVTTVTASDPNVGQTLSYSIIGGADASKFTIGSATGVLSFNTAPNFELPTDMGGNNIYDVIVEVSDGNGGIDTQAIAVTVTDAFENIAPIITSNGGGNTAAVSVAENSTAVTTVTATDPDVGQARSYSIIGGADASKFIIGATTGALSFITAPNFEAPTDAGGNNVYDVTVQASDGNGGIDTQAIAVTVTDVFENSAPTFTGGSGDDVILGNDGSDTMSGGAGNDVILGFDGNDTIGGDDGDDRINAGAGNDVIFGGTGNDEIGGGAGDDILVGQDGNDVIFGEDGNDVANAGAGADIMLGGLGNDTFGGGVGNDIVIGGDGDDLLFGEDGADNINGEFGNDGVVGGAGDDVLGGGAGDGVVGDDGNDVLFGETGNDAMNGGFGNDILLGSDGDDTLGGGAGDDDINGGFGNDVLFGENGNDILNGSAGNDVLIGGGNDDVFVFSPGDGADTIADFFVGAPEDKIWFAGTDLHSFADVQSHASFDAGTGATTITYNGFFTVTLNGVSAAQLTAGDFIFS